MNTPFLLTLCIGAVICAVLFAWQLKKQKMNPAVALAALPLGAALGLVLSKLLYCLLLYSRQFARYGLAALLRDKPSEFSFVGGCLGAVMGLCLTAKWLHMPLMKTLDVFAPWGALLIAIARSGEYHLGLVGVGSYVQQESLQWFPIALWNEATSGWYFAIFMLEALVALVCAAFAFFYQQKGHAAGRIFLFTLFFLLLGQVFCESLRSKCMKWGFVRIEQLLCGLGSFAIILYACRHIPGPKAYLPALCTLPCLLLLIAVEFLLDKPLFGTYLPGWLCYLAMLLVLITMALIACRAFKRSKA